MHVDLDKPLSGWVKYFFLFFIYTHFREKYVDIFSSPD